MSHLHVQYLLVGGGVASSAAAAAIRERDQSGSILLVGQEINRPYHRGPLGKDYLLGSAKHDDLFVRPANWYAERNVVLRTGVRASHLDLQRRAVMLDSGEEVSFDRLLLAHGASPVHLDIPGAQLPNIFYLKTIADADRLHNAIEKARREGRVHESGRGRAVVIGAGLLGLEMAGTLRRAGLAVEVVEMGAHPWQRFAGEMCGRFVGRFLASQGIVTHCGTRPARLEGDGRVQRVVLADGREIQTDLVIGAIGVAVNREILRGTAIAAEKRILTDSGCRTNVDGVFAAGACAAPFDKLFGKHHAIEHEEVTIFSGAVAGANMAGEASELDGVNHFASEVMGLRLDVWGEAKGVERRIVRGSVNVESPGFAELGIGPDGRIGQVVAVNCPSEEGAILRELVLERANVAGREERLKDPGESFSI